VVGGVFRFVRNPSYLAAITVLIGEALLFGSLPVLACALALAPRVGAGIHHPRVC
jgi:protein-S-isoprenylcysteine O-methyltransferase Ste14